jgi:hypothetical protein
MCHTFAPTNTRLDRLMPGPRGKASRKVNFSLPFEDHGELELAANEYGITVSQLLRRLIATEVDNRKNAQ